MRTLVAGATGSLGLRICEELAGRGSRVRALVRPTAAAPRKERLLELGVELVEGDLERPETLPAALAGVDRVVTTASVFPVDPRVDAIDRVDRAGSIALVDAAAAAGVARFVYTSFRPLPFDFPFQRAKRAVEARLAASGLDYTILRPASFMEVWFSPLLGFDVAAGHGAGLRAGNRAALLDLGRRRRRLRALGARRRRGAERDRAAWRPRGSVAARRDRDPRRGFRQAARTDTVPLEQLERQLAEADTPTGQSLAAVMLEVARGGVTEMSDLAASTGIRLTSVRALAERRHSRVPEGA